MQDHLLAGGRDGHQTRRNLRSKRRGCQPGRTGNHRAAQQMEEQAEATEKREEAILRSFAAAHRTPSVLRRGKKTRRAAFPKQGRSSPTPGQLHQEAVEADLEEAWTRWSSTCVPARKRKFARSPARTDEGATGSVGSRRPTNNNGLHARDWGRPQKGGRATWRILCPSSP